MGHKKKHVHPVPPANRPQTGPPDEQAEVQPRPRNEQGTGNEGGFQEQDPKRRLGDFTGAGEHSFQQPGGRNDANH
jgi:hypothetical protein